MAFTGAGLYSHHSGRTYRVLGLGKDMDTGKQCVIYTREAEENEGRIGLLWFSRELSSFNAQTFKRVDDSDLDGECLPKFRKSEEKTYE